jgi:hypothetical protein
VQVPLFISHLFLRKSFESLSLSFFSTKKSMFSIWYLLVTLGDLAIPSWVSIVEHVRLSTRSLWRFGVTIGEQIKLCRSCAIGEGGLVPGFGCICMHMLSKGRRIGSINRLNFEKQIGVFFPLSLLVHTISIHLLHFYLFCLFGWGFRFDMCIIESALLAHHTALLNMFLHILISYLL